MGVAPVSDGAFVKTLADAKSIALTAFTLPPGRVLDALAGAASNGADVDVTLAGDHFVNTIEPVRLNNLNAKLVLTHAGATFHTNTEKNSPGHPLHAKIALVDGVGYLDERNWPSDGKDLILRDDRPDDIAVMKKAVAGQVSTGKTLTTLKSDALALEAKTIADANSDTIDVATESFGPGAVADALRDQAEKGTNVRLVVVANDVYGADKHKQAKAEIKELMHAGVQVHVNTTFSSEKMAVLAGDSAWVGSTNATRGRPGQIDWGMRVTGSAIVDSLRAHFERTWDESVPYSARKANGTAAA